MLASDTSKNVLDARKRNILSNLIDDIDNIANALYYRPYLDRQKQGSVLSWLDRLAIIFDKFCSESGSRHRPSSTYWRHNLAEADLASAKFDALGSAGGCSLSQKKLIEVISDGLFCRIRRWRRAYNVQIDIFGPGSADTCSADRSWSSYLVDALDDVREILQSLIDCDKIELQGVVSAPADNTQHHIEQEQSPPPPAAECLDATSGRSFDGCLSHESTVPIEPVSPRQTLCSWLFKIPKPQRHDGSISSQGLVEEIHKVRNEHQSFDLDSRVVSPSARYTHFADLILAKMLLRYDSSNSKTKLQGGDSHSHDPRYLCHLFLGRLTGISLQPEFASRRRKLRRNRSWKALRVRGRSQPDNQHFVCSLATSTHQAGVFCMHSVQYSISTFCT